MRVVFEFLGKFSEVFKFLSSAIALFIALVKLKKVFKKRKTAPPSRSSNPEKRRR